LITSIKNSEDGGGASGGNDGGYDGGNNGGRNGMVVTMVRNW
jgi:hypothetical protein